MLLNSNLYWDFTIFSTNIFPCLFLFFMTLINYFEDYWSGFCRMFLNLLLSDVFPHDQIGAMDFEEEYRGVKCSSHHIRGYIIATQLFPGDVNPDHLVKAMFSRFLHCKIMIFPFPHSVLQKCESLGPDHIQGEVH